jgi:hypothetical protein
MNNSDYLLSFELEDEGPSLFIHGDANGLRALAQLLSKMVETTPEGYFDHEHLWLGNGLSEQGKDGQRINHVKIYCWRGNAAYGSHPAPQGLKNFKDHGYSLAVIKEWRRQEALAGRPSGLEDFVRAHGLCTGCRGQGLNFVADTNEWKICSICGGSGRGQPV